MFFNITQKQCTKCKIKKNLDDFYKSPKGKHGRQAECITCHKGRRDRKKELEYSRNFRKNNPDARKNIQKRYYEKHKDKLKAIGKIYRDNNKEKWSEKNKKWRINNPEKARSKILQWAINNPEKVSRIKKKFRENHKQEISEYNKRYAKERPDVILNRNTNRRARQLGATGAFTKTEFRVLCEKYGNKCLRCGEQKPLTADHVIPLSKGGVNDISNIQPLCRSCNSSKALKIIDYRT